MVDVRLINPFIVSSMSILKQVTALAARRGVPGVKPNPTPSYDVSVKVGVVGDISGCVTYSFDPALAKVVAAKMMGGCELDELNEMAQSALKELGNMISGRASIQISSQGIKSDITPPEIYLDKAVFKLDAGADAEKAIVVPLEFDEGAFEINIAISKKDLN